MDSSNSTTAQTKQAESQSIMKQQLKLKPNLYLKYKDKDGE